MKQRKSVIAKSRIIEDLQHLQLRMLLEELVQDRGVRKTAQMLGVDHRTLTSSMRAGELSKRMRAALGSALQEGFGSAAARQRERNDNLEARLEKVEGQLKEQKASLRSCLMVLNRLEGRLGRTESRSKELRDHLARAVKRLRMPLDGVRKYYLVQRRLIEQRLSVLESGREERETGTSADDTRRAPRLGSITPSALHPREFRGPTLTEQQGVGAPIVGPEGVCRPLPDGPLLDAEKRWTIGEACDTWAVPADGDERSQASAEPDVPRWARRSKRKLARPKAEEGTQT